MFPIAHNYMVHRLLANPDLGFSSFFSPKEKQLLEVGAVLPDLFSGMGLDRNHGHEIGKTFYHFTVEHFPDYQALALGLWLHGTDPCGFDYYADEFSLEGDNGWCFMQALPYVDAIVAACNLPENFGWWKSHNFVEMAGEVEINARYPDISHELLEARKNPELQQIAQTVLEAFMGHSIPKVPDMLYNVNQIFALPEPSPANLATKYANQLKQRHGIAVNSVETMSQIIEEIRHDLREKFWQWLGYVELEITKKLEENQVQGLKKA